MPRLTEKQVTKLYNDKKISLLQYQEALRKIASSRHQADVRKMRNRRSMSSSKWS